jgi:hypothetical protein
MGSVIKLFNLIEAAAHQKSGPTMEGVRHTAFRLAIDAGFKFAPDDIKELASAYHVFGADGGEYRYQQMIEAGNISACQSFEKYHGRPPMIWQGKRLHVGASLTWEGKTVKVTSFGSDHRGFYVGCCTYRQEKMNGSSYKREKVSGRLKIYQEELRKGERARNAPTQDAELLRFMRRFPEIFNWSGPKELAKHCRTMRDWWDAGEDDYHRKDDLEKLLVAIQFPVPLHVAKAWKSAADVKGFVGDFDTKVLPLIREEMQRRTAKAREKKPAESGAAVSNLSS